MWRRGRIQKLFFSNIIFALEGVCEIIWVSEQSKWSKSALRFRANTQTTNKQQTNIADTLKLSYHIPACSIVNAPSARKLEITFTE